MYRRTLNSAKRRPGGNRDRADLIGILRCKATALIADNEVMYSNPIVWKALNVSSPDIAGRFKRLDGQNEPCSQSIVGVPRIATAITSETAILIALMRRVLTPLQS